VLTVDYSYDAFGEMIQKNDGTVVSRYEQDGWNSNMLPSPLGGEGLGVRGPIGNENMNTWAVLNGSNQWQERAVWGDKVDQGLGRIVQAMSNYALYPLLDHQETVRDVIDSSGAVKDDITYDVWGQILNDTNISYRGRYGWTGRDEDAQTGLQYNRARWYDPVTGRWESQDPLGFGAGDSNLYRYVRNGPNNNADPSGEILPLIVAGGFARWRIRRYYLPPAEPEWYTNRKSGVETWSSGWKGTYKVSFEWFNDDEQFKLRKYIGHVRQALEDALPATPGDWPAKDTKMLERWFGNGKALSGAELLTIDRVLRTVRDAIDNKTLSFQNNKTGPDDYFAVSDPTGLAFGIALYGGFWERTQRRQVGTVFHELTHYYASTGDSGGYFLDASLGDLTKIPSYRDGSYGPHPPNSVLQRNADTYRGFLLENFLAFVPDKVP